MTSQIAAGLIAAGIALHLAGCIICGWAARYAAQFGLPVRERNGWIGCAAGFAGLACIRLLGAEDRVRQMLRSQLVLAGEYDQRWGLQGLLAAAIGIALLTLLALFLWRKIGRHRAGRARLLLTAQLALLGFVPLLALRVLSWHQTDRLLYDGPVRLNWILELLLAAVPMIGAMLYVRRIRQRKAGRGNTGADHG